MLSHKNKASKPDRTVLNGCSLAGAKSTESLSVTGPVTGPVAIA